MKNERRRINELNTLSAYLDNALEEKEVESLKARLEKEPELREKLDNLKRTKILLSRLDRVSAPRNYTLTPDMVKVRGVKNKPLFTTLRLASSFAAILLVALFGVQFVLQGGLTLPSMQSEAPMFEAARVEDEMTPEPLIFWGDPGVGGALPEGYGGGGPESMAEESFIVEEPDAEIGEVPEEEAAVEEELPESVPDLEISPQDSPEIERIPSEKSIEGSSPILGINPEQSGEILEQGQPSSEDALVPPDWSKIIQWFQIALAIIAVGGGLILWLLRRKA